MRTLVQLAWFGALLGWLSGCTPTRTSLDTIISARDALDFSVWQREHLPTLEQTWRKEFPRAMDRLRVDEAYRAKVSHPNDVEKLLFKRVHGSTIRDMLIDSYRIKLAQLLYIQKLTAALRQRNQLAAAEESADAVAEISLLSERLSQLDRRFDVVAFNAAIELPPLPPISRSSETPLQPTPAGAPDGEIR